MPPDKPDRPAAPEPPSKLAVHTFEEAGQTFAILDWPVEGDSPPAGAGLPGAQREVLALILAGASNAEIARLRRRSVRTVAHQVDAVFRRFRVGSRQELFALVARGLRPQDSS